MHCTLFGEDNGKQGREFRLRLDYSNVELQSAYRNRISHQQRRQCLAADHEAQSAQNKSTRGVEYIICRQKQSAPRHLRQTCTRKVRENTTLTFS